MKGIVVYESHWGNTAAVAQAIAEGLGEDVRAVTTDEATEEVVREAELIVAGAPVMAFNLPSDRMLDTIASDEKAPTPADLSHPSMRDWLGRLPAGQAAVSSFETALRFSPGSARGAIERAFVQAGYRSLADPQRFYVKGTYGPLRDGELDKARAWGAELRRALG